ncbi:MAG: SprB repeat-containing protein [Saprospiraceae bacterium]
MSTIPVCDPNSPSGVVFDGKPGQNADCTDNLGYNCWQYKIQRPPGSLTQQFTIKLGQGQSCNGELDASYVSIDGTCTQLSAGGSQTEVTFTYPIGVDEITLFMCVNSAGWTSMCNLCTEPPPCTPAATCLLSDINEVVCLPDVCEVPVAFTNPADVFDISGCTGSTLQLSHTDLGDTDCAGGLDFVRTYILSFLDKDGVYQPFKECVQNIKVDVFESPSCSITNESNESCGGAEDGSFELTVSGGAGPYDYTVTGAINGLVTSGTNVGSIVNLLISGLKSDTYTVEVTDNNGCSSSCNTSINISSDFQCESFTFIVGVSCEGDGEDGSATANASGGTPPYDYLWDNGEITQTATQLDAGEHDVLITDDVGCEITCTVDIPEATGCCELFVVCSPVETNIDCNNPIPAAASTEAEFEAIFGDVITGTPCNPLSITSNAVTPDYCTNGSQVVRTYTVTDGVTSVECTHTFNIVYTPPTLSDCPGNVTLDGCTDQTALDNAWNIWIAELNGMSTNGLCNPTLSYNPPLGNLTKPTICGNVQSSQQVIVTADDGCQQVSCTTTFVLQTYPGGLALDDCPVPVELDGCTADAAVTTAWDAWIASLEAMEATGGCSPVVSYDPPLDQLVQPSQCGEGDIVITVKVKATDLCDEKECSSSFTLKAYPGDLVLDDCPVPVELDGCTADAAVTTAWDAWIASLEAMEAAGGCSPVVSYDPPLDQLVQPSQCGEGDIVITVKVKATDLCDEKECSTSFTLKAYPGDLVLDDCPVPVELDGCTADAAVTTAWDAWIASLEAMEAAGGCSPVVSYDPPLDQLVQPSQCGEGDIVITVKVKATDLCDEKECSTSFTLKAYPGDLVLDDCPVPVELDGCTADAAVTTACMGCVDCVLGGDESNRRL